ncbi:ribbon-helix-helix domain-containing protein [Sandarakinorhabdus sp.]|uniref:ribbon-helix-helix domain-containing protein n=1 Tax=Sandarakinorhabdus sp. TaxID=1916663 RepID=UPI003F6FAB50
MATLTITLPDDLAADIRARVAAGEYPDEGAVIADWLRGLDGSPAALAQWHAEVAEIVDRLDAGQEPLLTLEDVMAELDEARRLRTAERA